jgi:hypothetical protein
MPRGGLRPGSGRRPIDIDLVELEKLAAIHCSDEEIAKFFGVSVRTIHNKRKHPEFRDAMERGKSKGCITLRRLQWKSAEKGNPSMLQFLGKQILGQRDTTPVELTGPNGKDLKIPWEVIREIL